MKNKDSVPRQSEIDGTVELQSEQISTEPKKKERREKKKKKRNLWPLKAFVLTLFLSAAVNAASEVVLVDSQWWLALTVTVIIMLLGVIFDVIGTAATSCDVQPFLAMASRKVKGAKLAVKLSQKSDVVSSICNDIVGDICGIVSGVCAATIVAQAVGRGNLLISVLIYALISTFTITLKAFGKGFAVKKANKIIYGVAKTLSIFKKEG